MRTCPRHPQCHTIHGQHAKKITLAARQKNKITVFRHPSSKGPPQPKYCACSRPHHSQHMQHSVCMRLCVYQRLYLQSRCTEHKRAKKGNGRERQIAHTQITHIITHTHAAAEWAHPTTKSKRKTKQKAEAWDDQRTHILITPVKQNTHRGRERGRPLNAMKTKQKQLRCSAHAARQDGSGACRAKESTNGPAWVCMHIYNGHIIVCASWGEATTRVHASGHTHRERRKCVYAGGARLSRPHSHAVTTAAAAAHATRRSKRGEVVWETAVLLSLSAGVAV
ncbi:hypothetical protein TCSYLVIO_009627 [Trypanosoma cruzi]|nr:hypothetical protein TCSYLVIO_009627 [Trypanosoma cruzi]